MLAQNERSLILALVVLSTALPALAKTPSLARLVPADAGLCLSADDLALHVERLRGGSMFARWQAFPPFQKWSEKNRPPIEGTVAEIGRQLDVRPEDVWRKIFGHRTLLAVWPSDADDGRDGPGLLLVESQDAALLSQLVEGLCEAQARAGEVVEAHIRSHAGASYHARVIRRGGGETNLYLASLGTVGVLTSHEHLMRRVLELKAAQEPPNDSLAMHSGFQQAFERLDPDAPLKLFVNARAWDRVIAKGAEAGQGSRQQRSIEQLWKVSPYWAFSLSVHPRLTLVGIAGFEELPSGNPWREGLVSMSGAARFSQHVPADCLAAVASTVQVGRLLRSAAQASEAGGDDDSPKPPEKKRRELAVLSLVWNLLDQTFHGLGPNFGGYVAAAEPEEESLPLDIVLGLEVDRHAAVDAPQHRNPAQALESLLGVAMGLHKQQHPESEVGVETDNAEGLKIWKLSDWETMPRGWQAAFTISRGFLLAGTSPAAVRHSATIESDSSLGGQPSLAALLEPQLREPGHLVYVNMAATRRWLMDHRDGLQSRLAEAKKTDTDQVARGLDRLLSVLNLADAFVLAAKIDSNGLSLQVSLSVDERATDR